MKGRDRLHHHYHQQKKPDHGEVSKIQNSLWLRCFKSESVEKTAQSSKKKALLKQKVPGLQTVFSVACFFIHTKAKMSDDKSKRRPQDANLINLNEDYEIRYWCEEFGCSREDLADAVQKVGNSAARVKEYLEN